MSEKNKRKSASEHIIIIQSVLLFSFGLAALSASTVIISGMDAMSHIDNAVTFITEDSLITNNSTIDIFNAKKVVANFEFICWSAMSISTIIFLATIYRIKKK